MPGLSFWLFKKGVSMCVQVLLNGADVIMELTVTLKCRALSWLCEWAALQNWGPEAYNRAHTRGFQKLGFVVLNGLPKNSFPDVLF